MKSLACLGELFSHFGNGHGRAHAGHHVFALGVHQEFAHKLLLAGGGSRVKATPVPELSFRLPNTMGCTLTAVPQE